MYQVVANIIGSSGQAVSSDTIVAICGGLILLLTVVFVDLIRDIFSGFIRG